MQNVRAILIAILFLAGTAAWPVSPAAAQTVGAGSGTYGSGAYADPFGAVNASGAAYYQFSQPGEATVEVMVMNSLGNSGIFRIGRDLKLDELLLLTGSRPVTAQTGEKTRTTVQLFRHEGGRRTLIYEKRMEELLQEPGLAPGLQDGDVFVVESVVKRGFDWRDALRIVTSVASVTLAIERLGRFL